MPDKSLIQISLAIISILLVLLIISIFRIRKSALVDAIKKELTESYDVVIFSINQDLASKEAELYEFQARLKIYEDNNIKLKLALDKSEDDRVKLEGSLLNAEVDYQNLITNINTNKSNNGNESNLKMIQALRTKHQSLLELSNECSIKSNQVNELRDELLNAKNEVSEIRLQLIDNVNLLEQREKYFLEIEEAYKNLERLYAESIVKINDLEEITSTVENIKTLRDNLVVYEDQHEIIAAGLYPLTLGFETPDQLREKLEGLRQELAEMVRDKSAAICSTKWTINGSTSEGTRATRHYIRIMLRTFNADADACLDLVRWNNLDKCIARLRNSYRYVNDLGSTHATVLQERYLDIRINQIKLMHEFKESTYRQREAQRAARLAAAEERSASREIERARSEAEAEEKRYKRAIELAYSKVTALVGRERDELLQQITDLQHKLEKASFLKQRAISMAQITKAGFVYVVSNIGSFGHDVLKIGMTRRIDPQERIRELGGASVPFHFDVHAMIYSDNAPELENLFHRQFARHRINLANGRKEFFRVNLSEVVDFSQSMSLEANFSTLPEAKDFHLSNELRSTVINTLTDDELNNRLLLIDDQFDTLDEVDD